MKNKIIRLLTREHSFFMAAPALIWQFLFLGLPVTVIIGLSVLVQTGSSWHHFFTLSNYVQLVDSLYLGIIARSLVLALSNAFLCLLFAYPVAYFVAFRARSWKNVLLLLLILPFWTNFLVQVYAWFFVLERRGFLNLVLQKIGVIAEPLGIMNTPFAIHLVMLFCYLPFMIMPIYTSLEKINKKLLEASYDLGANPWQTFMRITVPLSLSGIKTGFFLVFIPSFGEFVIPTLLGGGKTLYVGSLVSYYFVESRNIYIGSAFTILSAVVLLIAIALISKLFDRLMRLSSGQGII